MRQLCISVVVELPENPFDAAGIYKELNEPWSELVNALTKTGAKHTFKLDELEVRTKAKRAPRKPKLVESLSDTAA